MNVQDLKLNLIYKAKRDGFKIGDFHSRCDNKTPTICIIKSEHGKTFGGYTNLNWNQSGYIAGEGKSFIFQLDNNTKHKCINNQQELWRSSSYSIAFGGGCDIGIRDSSD